MTNTEGKMILKAIDDLKSDNKDGHKQIIDRLDKTNGNVMKNTSFRLETIGALKMIKVLLGLIGAGTVANIVLMIK